MKAMVILFSFQFDVHYQYLVTYHTCVYACACMCEIFLSQNAVSQKKHEVIPMTSDFQLKCLQYFGILLRKRLRNGAKTNVNNAHFD